MPTIRRSRTIGAAPEEVWRVVSDPERLPAWWPGVQRVEEVSADAWTNVLASPRGKTVRADYTLVDVEPLRRLTWRQEVEESPFERIMWESLTHLELEELKDEQTRVELTGRVKLRGFSRFGGIQVRRAIGRQLTEALEGLEELVG